MASFRCVRRNAIIIKSFFFFFFFCRLLVWTISTEYRQENSLHLLIRFHANRAHGISREHEFVNGVATIACVHRPHGCLNNKFITSWPLSRREGIVSFVFATGCYTEDRTMEETRQNAKMQSTRKTDVYWAPLSMWQRGKHISSNKRISARVPPFPICICFQNNARCSMHTANTLSPLLYL